MIRVLKVFAKSLLVLFTLLFLFLFFTGILSDVYLMFTVPDEETYSLFKEGAESWDTVQR
jgi:hypothetical protein